jgi:hypothetical protein
VWGLSRAASPTPRQRRAFVPALLVLVAILTISPPARGDKEQRRRDREAVGHAVEQLLAWGMVARVPLKDDGEYHVRADGEPEGNQGKMFGINMFSGVMALRPGDTPKGFAVAFKKKSMILTFRCCRNRRPENSGARARIHVELGHSPTAEDLEPAVLKRALGGFFDIGGPSEEAALAEVLEALEGTGPETAELPEGAPHRPTVLDLRVEARPSSIRLGDKVELILRYRVAAPGAGPIRVTEERVLSFGGTPLPGYPNRVASDRSPGVVETSLPQLVPAGASPGNYELRGEVCVEGDCISRRMAIQVRAPER